MPIVADARKLSDIKNGAKQAAGRFGSIDIAIHNACHCTFMSEPDSDYDVYRDVMDDAFNRCEKCSEEHFAWEEEYCESLTSQL